ncbi:MAG: hypothetical protein A2107_13915 [Verrucomicrobia bacterium GWF2_62_7]|nr:MAG: hypothetical protein A2107_13915 [Verrucomicrobia bacterium GWF2_62_7]
MNHRGFLAAAVSAAIVYAALTGVVCDVTAADAPETADKRPNILYCLADDWGWPHAPQYGDKVIQVPTFDRVAREGVLFTHAFCASPSRTPSRGAMLTGQAIHRLEAGGNLWSVLPKKFKVYPDLLEEAGYFVGLQGKGLAPGDQTAGGWPRNPSGPAFKSFEEFFKQKPAGKPFCFWFGCRDPHRPYAKDSGARAGMKPEDVFVPPYLPDTPEVRGDILDYYFAVQRFDADAGKILKLVEEAGELDNTLVVMTGDNGWPFPHGKANLYDAGVRQPLAVRWPAKFKGGRVVDAFVSLTDIAPTFLEATGLKPLPEMTGRSWIGLLTGADAGADRGKVFVERERHDNCRANSGSYPSRAVRTKEFLYIRNYRPDRWPAGDPDVDRGQGHFGEIDPGPTKSVLLERRDDPAVANCFHLATDKRPAEELYDLAKDAFEQTNVAGQPAYADAQKKLHAELERWQRDTADPRIASDDDRFDRYEYVRPKPRKQARKEKR